MIFHPCSGAAIWQNLLYSKIKFVPSRWLWNLPGKMISAPKRRMHKTGSNVLVCAWKLVSDYSDFVFKITSDLSSHLSPLSTTAVASFTRLKSFLETDSFPRHTKSYPQTKYCSWSDACKFLCVNGAKELHPLNWKKRRQRCGSNSPVLWINGSETPWQLHRRVYTTLRLLLIQTPA